MIRNDKIVKFVPELWLRAQFHPEVRKRLFSSSNFRNGLNFIPGAPSGSPRHLSSHLELWIADFTPWPSLFPKPTHLPCIHSSLPSPTTTSSCCATIPNTLDAIRAGNKTVAVVAPVPRRAAGRGRRTSHHACAHPRRRPSSTSGARSSITKPIESWHSSLLQASTSSTPPKVSVVLRSRSAPSPYRPGAHRFSTSVWKIEADRCLWWGRNQGNRVERGEWHAACFLCSEIQVQLYDLLAVRFEESRSRTMHSLGLGIASGSGCRLQRILSSRWASGLGKEMDKG